jgi:hypothetical protein
VNRALQGVKEFLRPTSVKHHSLPPLEAGLRPNSRLEQAVPLTPPGDYEPDDVCVLENGGLRFTAGTAVMAWESGNVKELADVGGPAGPLVRRENELIVGVDGRGLVAVSESGQCTEICSDPAVQRSVTDLAVRPDGSLIVAVGSTEFGADGWARALIAGQRTGRLATVDGARAEVVAERLPWPSGVAVEPDGSLLVSLSHGHRIERRSPDQPDRGRPVLDNLAFFPGRIRVSPQGWWVAAPYLRNRATELLLSEPEMRDDMVSTVGEAQWLLPSLRRENIYLDPLQMGQLRVLGVLKPWAPPRSYGLVFLFGGDGRVIESHHSRADGTRHGITGVDEAAGRVVVAGKGCRALLELRRDDGGTGAA